jgi:hypothetical protein
MTGTDIEQLALRDAQRRLFNDVVSPSIGSDVQFNELERLPSRYNH